MKKAMIRYIFKVMTKELCKELLIKLLNWYVNKTETKKDDELLALIIETWECNKEGA